MISLPLLRHTWRTHRVRLAIVSLSLAIWAFLMPVIMPRDGSLTTEIVPPSPSMMFLARGRPRPVPPRLVVK